MRTSTLSALLVIVIVACVVDTGRAINVGGRIANGAKFVQDAYRGTKDMWRGYSDMRKANWVGADKYFHARANYDASRHGAGGRWAAEAISDAREFWQGSVSGRGHADSAADQEANRWGRSGGDPNRYRPNGLPDEY